MDARLPWHDALWQQFQERVIHDRLPHALLLNGAAGLGKGIFARRMARALLCETPDAHGDGCGHCRACRLLQAGSHPDYRALMPEKEGAVIKVDAVRELCIFLGYTAQYGGHKIALLEPADRLNVNAANSLLKTLEEPSTGSLLLLVTAQPARLPATVRSRCQRIHFDPPPPEMAQSWLAPQLKAGTDPKMLLAVAGGAPLAALGNAEGEYGQQRQTLFENYHKLLSGQANPLQVAEIWAAGNLVENLRGLIGWHTDLIRLKMSDNVPRLNHPDWQPVLAQLAQRQAPQKLFERLDAVIHLHRLCTTTQVNAKMQLEVFFSGGTVVDSDIFQP